MLALLVFAVHGIFSQTADSIKHIQLNELVISVNKSEESRKSVAQEVKVLLKREIQSAQALSTADLMSNIGIFVQKSQLGGGSPVLRGFEASRIVLMIDGVRMNNLIYRAGHLQDLIKTDNESLERVEVLYGPSSGMYGSDALGGVIHLYTKKPAWGENESSKFKLNILSRYESASKGITEHVDLNYGGRKLALLTSVSYNRFGDLRSGRNQNPFYTSEYGTRPYYVEYVGNGRDTLIKNEDRFLQAGSGYSQYDIIQKFAYRKNDYTTHSLNLQYSNSTDVPRYDRLTDPSGTTGLRSAEWYYGPQRRILAAYDLNIQNPEWVLEDIHIGINYQNLEESRHNRNFNSTFRNNRIEKVSVAGVQLDFIKRKGPHQIRFGADAQLNHLKSRADKENIVDGTLSKLDTRYPDGENAMNNFAVYVSHTWKLNPELNLVDGFRIGYSTLHSSLVDTATLFHLPYTDISQKTAVYSGSIGIIHNPSDDLKLSFLLSTGFRVPNVDDLSKIFGSKPGSVIVPNKDLKPEKTINYEFGISKQFEGHTRWESSIFYTDFRDIAVVDAFNFNGQDSILYDGILSRVYANQNKNKAYLYGFSSGLRSRLDAHLQFNCEIQYTYGRIKTDSADAPLDHIPPFSARIGIGYTHERFQADFLALYNGWKRIKEYYLNGEDNEQYATAEGMPAWFTLNLRFSYELNSHISIQAGADNLLDTQYRTFASGINAPGRNFIAALRAQF